jgi:hypothetical protein
MNDLAHLRELVGLTRDNVAVCEEIVHAFGWQPAQTRTGNIKAVGTGPHSGRALYGAKAQAALAAKGGKSKPEPAKKEEGKATPAKKQTTEARMEMNVKKATQVATEHLREAQAAEKAGDLKKAQGLRAAAYGMNRAAKYIEDGDLTRARASIETAREFAAGKRQLRTAPQPGAPNVRSAIAFRGKAAAAPAIVAKKTTPALKTPAKAAPDVAQVVARMKAIDSNRKLTIPEVRAGMNELEKLPKEAVAEVAKALGFGAVSKFRSKEAMLDSLRKNLEGLKLSQHRADRITNMGKPKA